MALRAVKGNETFQPGSCDVVEVCPICAGKMETVYSRNHQKVCVCVDCHSSITVPQSAWAIKATKER